MLASSALIPPSIPHHESPPRIRQSKRKFAQVDREDDEADIDDPYAKIYRSFSANTIAHRRAHSPLRVQRRINTAISGAEDDEESQRLFIQPPDELLPPNIFPHLQTQDNYSMTDTEREIVVAIASTSWTGEPSQAQGQHTQAQGLHIEDEARSKN
jgi:hypothetical protein